MGTAECPPMQMSPDSPAAKNAADRVWNTNIGDSKTAIEAASEAALLLDQLRVRLGRWIGVGGYDTLFGRAIDIAREEPSWVNGLFDPRSDPSSRLAVVEYLDAAEISAACTTLLAILIDLLGRIVGLEMAARLVEQSGSSGPRSTRGTEIGSKRDG